MTKGGYAFRNFTALEQRFFDKLLEKEFPGRDEICEQRKKCLVRTIDENKSLGFLVEANVESTVKRRIPV